MNRKRLFSLTSKLKCRFGAEWDKVQRSTPATRGICIWYTHIRVEYFSLYSDMPPLGNLENDELFTYASRLHALACVVAVTDGVLHHGGEWSDILDLCEDLYIEMTHDHQ